MRFFVPVLPALLLSLSACFDNPADKMAAAPTSGPPPAELCDRFRTGLETLSGRGAFDYEDDGSAVIEEGLWMRMGAGAREKVGQMLAFHAACVARQGSDAQRVIVRNQFGNVVSRRTIDTRVNTMSMIAD